MKTAESAVLRSCLEYLRFQHHQVVRINCGGGIDRNGRPIKGTDINGVSDIMGITFDGRPLCVECKSDKGRLSRHQEIWKAGWLARGGVYVLARGIEDLQGAGL
ncbi:MAG: hypothetical protein LBH43_15625 [Treponema sp.]|jgi:hypothetical protein|nr:hypothetical protein [Treponema sp.]